MRIDRWRLAGLLFGLALLLAVGWQLLAYRDQLAFDPRRLSWPLLVGAMAAALAAQGCFAAAWRRLLGTDAAPGWRDDAARWGVSLGGKYVPGKVFHALARIGLYRGRVAAGRLAPVVVRELLLGLGAACAWVALHAASDPRAAVPWWPVAGAALVLAALAVFLPTPGLRVLSGKDDAGAAAGATAGRPRGTDAIAAWILQALGYLLVGLSVAALAQALVPTAPGWLACTAAFCFAGVAGVLALVVPAGIGVREAALAWYLAAWLGAGPAALVALAARACLTLAEFLAVLLGLWHLRHAARRSNPVAVPPPDAAA
jgi:glycosyltransferase 2 family protein